MSSHKTAPCSYKPEQSGSERLASEGAPERPSSCNGRDRKSEAADEKPYAATDETPVAADCEVPPCRSCQDSVSSAQKSKSRMRRKRYQSGSIGTRRHGRTCVWVAQWSENGNRRSKVLGNVGAMTSVEAHLALAEILRPINEGATDEQLAPYTFDRFVNEMYLPHCRQTWKASTAYTSEHIVKLHLLPELGDRLLTSVTRRDMQDLLEAKAKVLANP